jgi:NAD(P)H dehydrogenase (quinone)
MAELLGRDVRPFELPRGEWSSALKQGGLSESYAGLVTELYEAHNAGRIDAETKAGPVLHGKTELHEALRRLAQ